MKKAIVLLSGGLDSVTTLFYAKKKGYKAAETHFAPNSLKKKPNQKNVKGPITSKNSL